MQAAISDGGTALPEALCGSQNHPAAIAVDGCYVYWVNAERGQETQSGQLMRTPKPAPP